MYAEVIKKEDGTLSYRTLAGTNSDGLPLGTIIAIHRTTCPGGFLPCNGTEFDTEQYPALYLLLGSNKTPDLREVNLVGIGVSERDIPNHDTYTLGQFKDDQMQLLSSGIATNGTEGDAKGIIYSDVLGNTPETYPVRYGSTTHGKNYGVNYVIKAHTGLIENSDADIYGEIVAYLDEHYAHDDLINLYNNSLVKYDAVNRTYVPVERPTVKGQVLEADVSSSYYYTKDNVIYYNADMTEAEEVPSTEFSKAIIGYSDKNSITITESTIIKQWKADDLFFDEEAAVTEENLDTTVKSYKLSETAKVYNNKLYDVDSDNVYKEVIGLTSTLVVLGDVPEVDLSAIDVTDLYYIEHKHDTLGKVISYTQTGFITEDTDETLDETTYIAVYCNTYYGTEYDYHWKNITDNKGVAFIGTEEDYEVAKLIPEGQEGYIPSGSLVIITDDKQFVYGE